MSKRLEMKIDPVAIIDILTMIPWYFDDSAIPLEYFYDISRIDDCNDCSLRILWHSRSVLGSNDCDAFDSTCNFSRVDIAWIRVRRT